VLNIETSVPFSFVLYFFRQSLIFDLGESLKGMDDNTFSFDAKRESKAGGKLNIFWLH
jgi:hypothetical protein